LVYLDLIKNKAIDIGVNTPISTQQILAMEKLLVPKKIEKKSTTVTIKSSLQGTAKL
jgi:hypothetical protein